MSNEEENEEGRPNKRLRLDVEETPGSPEDSEQPSGSSTSNANARVAEPALSERLRKVMLCTVCLELPHPDDSYQCNLGHIVCDDCATRLLAEAAINNRDAQCPHCRTHICWDDLTKNLAVGQTLWELSKSCPDCEEQIEFKSLSNHLKTECRKRAVRCQYRCLGCPWQGTEMERAAHEADCKHLQMSSDEILSALKEIDRQDREPMIPLRICHRHLSAYRISYGDLDLHWPHHQNLHAEIRFQSNTIVVFEQTWRMRMRLRHANDSDRRLNYSLRLLTSPPAPLKVKYFVTLPAAQVRPKQLRDMELQMHLTEFVSTGQNSEFKPLPLRSQIATYRLLAMPVIKLRLWMMMMN